MSKSSKPNKNSKKKKDASSAAEWLIDAILKSEAVLFHDQRNVAYIAYHGNGTKVDRIESKDFKDWLHHYHWQHKQKPLPRDTDTRVIHTLASRAKYDEPQHSLSVRVAKNNDELWYDLNDGQAVKLTTEGWQIVKEPPIMFRRFSHQQPQVHPEKGGDVHDLRPLINVSDENDDDWLLFLVNLIVAFLPSFPHPILILYGPQGAGKTTPMRIMKKVIDPSVLQGMLLPSKEVEFVQLADHHAFLFFDNLSGLSAKMSDALARASTGDGFSSRELYTNDDDFIRIIQRPIALNGINQVVVKPDLLDRAILIKLERIAEGLRVPEDEFWQVFESVKSGLLGAIFDVLAKAMAIYPNVELKETPRMADFTRWGCAIAEAAGYSQEQFLKAYRDNIKRLDYEAIEANPVARAVILLMRQSDDDQWQGTPAELLNELKDLLPELGLDEKNRYWPKDPVWMSRRLNEVQVNLGAIGLVIEHSITSDGRTITITKELSFTADTEIPLEDIPDFDEPPAEPTESQGSLLDDEENSKSVDSVKS